MDPVPWGFFTGRTYNQEAPMNRAGSLAVDRMTTKALFTQLRSEIHHAQAAYNAQRPSTPGGHALARADLIARELELRGVQLQLGALGGR